MPHYAFTSPMSLTGPEEQTKYACLLSAVGRMFCLVFRSLHAQSLGQVRKKFFTIEIGHEIFSRAIFSLPLIQVGQFLVTG